MKILKNIKSERGQAVLVGVAIYIIGIICECLGYLTFGLKLVSFMFLLMALIYNIALYKKWFDVENKLLKITKVTLFFIITSLIIIFITWFNKMYFTFAFTIIFAGFLIIIFVYTLAEICSMYKDLDKRE